MAAHGGDVRCGRCAKVFNARVYLEHELEELEGQAKLPFEESGEPAAIPEKEAERHLGAVEQIPAEEFVAPSWEESPVEDGDLQPLPAAASESVAPASEETDSVEPTALAPQFVSEPSDSRDIFDEIEDTPKKRRFFWLWLIGTLLLLTGLGMQGLYFYRSDLAAHYPEFKPFLQQFCGVLRCTIRLPANPDLLSIETSNLEADPQQANLVALNAILRNRAKLAQEYPQLELTLTDTQDQMIARRIFTPGEYAKGADLNRGMAPNEEVTVKLNLDLGDLKAAGYRVFLFYPQ